MKHKSLESYSSVVFSIGAYARVEIVDTKPKMIVQLLQ